MSFYGKRLTPICLHMIYGYFPDTRQSRIAATDSKAQNIYRVPVEELWPFTGKVLLLIRDMQSVVREPWGVPETDSVP